MCNLLTMHLCVSSLHRRFGAFLGVLGVFAGAVDKFAHVGAWRGLCGVSGRLRWPTVCAEVCWPGRGASAAACIVRSLGGYRACDRRRGSARASGAAVCVVGWQAGQIATSPSVSGGCTRRGMHETTPPGQGITKCATWSKKVKGVHHAPEKTICVLECVSVRRKKCKKGEI